MKTRTKTGGVSRRRLTLETLEPRTLFSSNPVLIRDGFETGAPSVDWDEVSTGHGHLTVERGVAHSGNYAARIHYDQDECEGKLQLYDLAFEEVYVRFWQMYPTGYNQRNLKQAMLFHAVGGVADGSVLLAFWGQTNPAGNEAQTTFYGSDSADWSIYQVTPGEWMKTAFYVKYNTPGMADGIYRLWRNDQLIVERTDVIYRSGATGANGIWVGGNYSGSKTDPVPFDRYLDDIYIAQTPEGDLGSNSVNQPPVLNPIADLSGVPGKPVTFTATATDPNGDRLTYSLDSGAPAGAAMAPATGVFTWTPPLSQPPGEYRVTVRVTDNGSPPLADSQLIVITVNPSVMPQLNVSDKSIVEGNSGRKQLAFTVTLSERSRVPVSVHYATADGSAIQGQDYLSRAGDLTFRPGQTRKTIKVPIRGDRLLEGSETLELQLSAPENVALARDSAIATIIDNDLRAADRPQNVRSGLNLAYYEGDWDRLPDFRHLTPVATGRSANFTLAPLRDWSFGYVFEGYLRVPRNGVYTLSTTSDDGSRLWIGDTLVVDNDGLHAAQTGSGAIGLRAGYHKIRVEFFERGGEEILDVEIQGPRLAKTRITDAMLFS